MEKYLQFKNIEYEACRESKCELLKTIEDYKENRRMFEDKQSSLESALDSTQKIIDLQLENFIVEKHRQKREQESPDCSALQESSSKTLTLMEIIDFVIEDRSKQFGKGNGLCDNVICDVFNHLEKLINENHLPEEYKLFIKKYGTIISNTYRICGSAPTTKENQIFYMEGEQRGFEYTFQKIIDESELKNSWLIAHVNGDDFYYMDFSSKGKGSIFCININGKRIYFAKNFLQFLIKFFQAYERNILDLQKAELHTTYCKVRALTQDQALLNEMTQMSFERKNATISELLNFKDCDMKICAELEKMEYEACRESREGLLKIIEEYKKISRILEQKQSTLEHALASARKLIVFLEEKNKSQRL